MLSTSAFNAFLKTLEEPPAYAIFILATTEKHKILPTILSRCQIFDFNRIQISDMTNHLANIASQEGINAEVEALELIAQKADGGLRDALSMFDLNVTFSQDNVLRYAEVLENLHILDYDYYFRMTEALMAANISDTYLLFDEILKKGFDGHQFVVGLLEHFRNLLVCKDPVTVKLLQVSESVQQKYLAQAAVASYSFLVSAMSLGSQCDLNYKAAKNQKLHVEISLLKMANLTNVLNLASLPAMEGDGGKKSSEVTAPAVAAPQPANGSVTPVATPSVPATGAIPKVTGLRSTSTIVNKVVEKETPTLANTVQESQPLTNRAVTYDGLKTAWDTLVEHLKERQRYSEYVILNRLFELKGTTIYLAVDNEIQQELLTTALRTEVLTYLRKEVRNSTLHLEVSILEQEKVKMIYTQAEKFNFLAEKNPALNDLRLALGLDYDY